MSKVDSLIAFNYHPTIDEMSTVKEDDSPQQQINEQSITQDLEKNRESLKRKLQTRRSLKQLADVGIIPSLPFYEQRKQLQMRKTQDILKHKILSRPDRQLLIEHNILSDTTAAPAIQKTQCQLKRARLVDNLNDKLSARPGILELVVNNIFEIDSNLKQAIQGGHIQFPSTKLTIDKQRVRPLRQKTPSLPNTAISKRSLNSIVPKSKSCLTFHEYKGPSRKFEVTKVSLPPTLDHTLNDNHYTIQLRQQQLFLELVHHNKSIENEDNSRANLLQQPIDENIRILSYETMKLADLKNVCRKLNISITGTKMKLIEKLKNARVKISDTTILPSQTINTISSSSMKLLLSASSLTDQELYQQQQQKLAELENQLEKLKQFDSLLSDQNQSSPTIIQHVDSPTTAPPKCNPILSVQIQKRILTQQQEKLKQKIQQHSIIPESSLLFQPTNTDIKFNDDNNIISNLLDDYTESTSTFTFPFDDSNATSSSPSTQMDWMTEASPSIASDFYDDNFTQFLNQFGNDHYHLFDSPLSTTKYNFI